MKRGRNSRILPEQDGMDCAMPIPGWSPASPTATRNASHDCTASPSGRRRPPTRRPQIAHLISCLATLLTVALSAAELRVTGLGWFGSRETARNLQLLLGDQLAPATIDAPPIEDAALILFHELQRDGYLDARVTAEIVTADGKSSRHSVTATLDEPLPRPLAVRRVVFHVERGTRFLIREVTFRGLQAMKVNEAQRFFTGETMLIPLAADRVYSPDGVRTSLSNLAEELRLRGYADAVVTLAREEIDRATGRVRLEVTVNEGPVWRVDAVHFADATDPAPPADFLQDRRGLAWSTLWRQDAATAVRAWYFARGYPDVRVRITPRMGERSAARASVTAEIRVVSGAQVHLGRVRIEGNTHTRERSMRRMLRLHSGDLLNPVEIDNAQARLARLGVFNRIDLRYDDAEPGVRDAIFSVTEGRRQEVNLLAGYGSYEQLRAGVEWQQHNVFGRAHTSNLRFVQSMKSSTGDFRYTVPSLFGTEVDGSARLFGLRREELSFVRQEFGTNLSLAREFPSLHSTGTASYTLQRLKTTANELATNPIDETETDVASLDLRLVRDRRDNPLTPRAGHRLFAQVQLASKVLGGEVDYQQFQLGASYHRQVGSGRWVHLGLEHAVVTTFGANDDRALPVNVRFFPGGDTSIRGYNRGEAAPRSAHGQFVGAKSVVQFNAEFEQALTPKFSAVAFGDALGTAARLADYPFDEKLFSVGLGLRYHTLIGPVRVEYGRNVNPRLLDPRGTLLVSVGFPF